MRATLKHYLFRVIPKSLVLFDAPTSKPVLYLTFDDGPHPKFTEMLLNLLALHNVKVTFFCIGNLLNNNHEIAKRITIEGHTLSNHSYKHSRFSSLSSSKQLEEIEKTDSLISKITGFKNVFFRAPQGKWSLRLIFELWRRSLVAVHWSYDSLDYQKGVPENIIDLFLKNPVKNGDIILFHDDNENCIKALSILLPKWKSEGFSFARINDIL